MADPLGMLQAALVAEPNTKIQAEHLDTLRKSLERNIAPIKVMASLLTTKTLNSDQWLLKSWVLDVFHYALAQSALSIEDKTHC